LLFFGLCSLWDTAQQPDDQLSIYNYNTKFLEHLLKEKIDSVRIAHNLLPLYNDTIIYKAARFHAAYLFELGDLNHSEVNNKEMETPQKRVDHFGAVNYLVGENIAFTYVGKPTKDKKGKVHTNMTYNQTANDLAIAWVNSPGHYKNIITQDYNATGMAVWTDEQKGRVYAVQNFAQILFKYDFQEDKNFFSFSNFVPSTPPVKSFEGIAQRLHSGKHAFKIKNPKRASDCERCIDTSARFVDYSKLVYRNGAIYFTCFDLMWMYQLLEKKKDGFAVELVAYNAYDCGNPTYYTEASRRNYQCAFSGKITKPVYLKKAIRGFKSGKDRKKILKKIQEGKIDRYEIKLGKIPQASLLNYLELNLVVLQKKKVCRIVKFSGYETDTIRPNYKTPLYLSPIDTTQFYTYFTSRADFKIPFLKGKAEYKTADVKPFTDSLLSANFKIDSLQIHAFASVEGSESVNQKLLEARSAQITRALAGTDPSGFQTKLQGAENWELFEQQIRENERLKDFRNLNRAEIKTKLEDSVQQKRLEPFLQQQRSMHIQLWAKVQLDSKNTAAFLSKKISSQKRSIDSLLKTPVLNEQRLGQHIDTLKMCLNTAAKQRLPIEFFGTLKLPKHPFLLDYEMYRLNVIAYSHSNLLDSIPQAIDFYSQLTDLYNQGQQTFFSIYNMVTILQRYQSRIKNKVSDEINLQLITHLLKFDTDSAYNRYTEQLALNFWFKMCDKPWEDIPKEKRAVHESCLNAIHHYYENKPLTAEGDNRLARFYTLHSRFQWAYDRLIKYYDQSIENPDGIIILSKILYEDYQFVRTSNYGEFLKSVYPILGKERWCPMFIGDRNISFQVFDNEDFKNYYCERCSDYLNEAKRP
jgi:uncharacterized protein YkwD